MTARVGCSGWMYKHWRGVVYPEGLPARRGEQEAGMSGRIG
ncbi:MAG: hypothetical protein ACYDH5_10925 [Acidimicrobiales bacterium]